MGLAVFFSFFFIRVPYSLWNSIVYITVEGRFGKLRS